MSKEITLASGEKAWVSDADHKKVSQHRWRLLNNHPGRKHFTYYATTKINKKTVLMHRLILRAKIGQQIDHADGNGLNNVRENIRFCNQSQNNHNRHKKGQSNQYGYEGVQRVVWYHNGKKVYGKNYSTQIKYQNRTKYIGVFPSAKEASIAYQKEKKKILCNI